MMISITTVKSSPPFDRRFISKHRHNECQSWIWGLLWTRWFVVSIQISSYILPLNCTSVKYWLVFVLEQCFSLPWVSAAINLAHQHGIEYLCIETDSLWKTRCRVQNYRQTGRKSRWFSAVRVYKNVDAMRITISSVLKSSSNRALGSTSLNIQYCSRFREIFLMNKFFFSLEIWSRNIRMQLIVHIIIIFCPQK